MRVLQILPELNVGGVETGTVDFAKYLHAHGHHAVVVSHGGALVGDLEKEGIVHYTLPVHKKSLWAILASIKSLKKLIIDEKIEIVHARSRVPGWIAYWACRHTQAKFITTCHGYYSRHLFSAVMGFPKIVIVPSEVIGRHMIDNFQVPSENIRCIPRSVDLRKYNVRRKEKPNESTCVISIVGRITPLKGHIYFLKAMAKVVRTMPFVKIWIIGDVPPKKEVYKQELQVLVRRLGLTDTVEFLGTRQDIPELLSKTDVLVMSSITPEAFGRVIVEAQAAGVPVVATKVGGVGEIIDDEKTGLLVLPKDPDAMADAVLRLLKDKKLSRQLTLEARKKLEAKFTLDHMASQTMDVYKELSGTLNILVMKMSSLGDVILVTASLKALRKKFPKARIYCLVGKESRKILQRCPCIDGIIVIDSKYTDKGFWRLWKFSAKLRKYKFDWVVDFQNNTRSHLLAFLSWPKESFGFNNKKMGFLLTRPVINAAHHLPPVEHQFQILKMLGISYEKDVSLELWPSETDKKNVKKLLDAEWLGNSKNVVGINLSASMKWHTKNWPLEHMARLCDILAGQNIRVLITGMDKDKMTARKLLTLTKTKPAVFVGKTDVLELAVLIQRCKVFVSPDSAPLHMAAAARIPFVALFGPTDSSRHLPPAKSCVVLEKKMICAPCYKPYCRIKTHACMKDILPQEVAQRITQLMKESK